MTEEKGIRRLGPKIGNGIKSKNQSDLGSIPQEMYMSCTLSISNKMEESQFKDVTNVAQNVARSPIKYISFSPSNKTIIRNPSISQVVTINNRRFYTSKSPKKDPEIPYRKVEVQNRKPLQLKLSQPPCLTPEQYKRQVIILQNRISQLHKQKQAATIANYQQIQKILKQKEAYLIQNIKLREKVEHLEGEVKKEKQTVEKMRKAEEQINKMRKAEEQNKKMSEGSEITQKMINLTQSEQIDELKAKINEYENKLKNMDEKSKTPVEANWVDLMHSIGGKIDDSQQFPQNIEMSNILKELSTENDQLKNELSQKESRLEIQQTIAAETNRIIEHIKELSKQGDDASEKMAQIKLVLKQFYDEEDDR